MVADELGFMVLGGVLGVLGGAALIVVLRSRPPAPRQIRLTMTPGSVPVRGASTLADDAFGAGAERVARGGPADIEWHLGGPSLAFAASSGSGSGNGTPVRSSSSSRPLGSLPRPARRPGKTATELLVAATEPAVAIREPVVAATEPVATATEPTVAAAAESIPVTTHVEVSATADASATAEVPATSVAVATLVERPGRPVGLHETRTGSGVAVLEAAIRARRGTGTGDDVATAVTTMTLPAGSIAMAVSEGLGARADSRGVEGSDGRADAAQGRAETDPCAEARHTVDERCALAERMRGTATRAADALHEAQRTYDVHVAHADSAAAIADARAQRAAKDAAQRAFRDDRSRAGSREAVENAARDWLQEINRINATAREAGAAVGREREAATALQPVIERLTIEADAARVQAEGAEESCLHARESLAGCEESAARAARIASGGGEPPEEPADVGVPAGAGGGSAAAQPPEEEGALAAAIHAGGSPAIIALLAGDRAVMQRLVTMLAGSDPVDQRRWQVQLADLVDAIVARAIEACAFVFPADHPFWGPFDRSQGRDIALALSSIGYRFDGLGGFADERIPSQRDVSLALGYAGLDPMRVRRWPTEAEMADLYRDVTVAADEYIAGAASGLTLGELVTLLGRRADALTEVWNAWGRIRPILLESV